MRTYFPPERSNASPMPKHRPGGLSSGARRSSVETTDLTATKAGGLQTDLAAAFLQGLADAAGLTIHVRLFEGEDSQHVLSAIFKALGAALAEACSEP